MKITFYNPAGIRTLGPGLEKQKGIGTAERAVIEASRELAAMGDTVTIFGNTPREFDDMGVHWIGDFSRAHECDVLVVYRVPRIPENITAKHTIYWSQDDSDCPAMQGFGDHAHKFERILPLSEYHARRLIEAGADPRRIRVLPVGVNMSVEAAAIALTSKENAVCYASAPFKGLPLLATLWPKIYARHPELELRIFSDMHMHGSPENDARFIALYDALRKMPGVKYHGTIPQHELHKEIARCRLMLYPNFYPETYGNSTAEAVACLCPVITSDLGALPEVVGKAGIIIPGSPKSAEYRAAFVDAVDRALEIEDELRHECMQRTKTIPCYAEVARMLRAICEEVLA